jgi:hypothetical protein
MSYAAATMTAPRTAPGKIGFAFAAIALALAPTDGMYGGWPALGALGLLVAALWWLLTGSEAKGEAGGAVDETRLVALALVLLVVVGGAFAPAMYAKGWWFRAVWIASSAGVAAAVWRVWAAPGAGARAAPSTFPWFVALAALAVALRVLMIFASPRPIIDVWQIMQTGSDALLHGVDPYTVPVPDIYQGTEDYGYPMDFPFNYPPANILLHVLPYAVLKDARFGYVIAEAVAVAVVMAAAGGRRASRWSQLAMLMFLWHPRGVFSLEMAWTEPYMVLALAVCAAALVRRRVLLACAAFGLAVTLKQYVIPLGLPFLFVVTRLASPRRVAAGVALGAAVALAPWVPFALWHPEPLYRYGLLFQVRATTFRADGLTLMAPLHALTGLTVGKGLAALVMLATGGALGWRLRPLGATAFLFVAPTALLAGFLVGSQAFCNYYYFIGALVAFLLALGPWARAASPT